MSVKRTYGLLLPVLAVLLAPGALARPVSYPDGWTIMQMNSHMGSSLHVHYSPTAQYSIGIREEITQTGDDNEYSLHSLQINRLLYRNNTAKSQANLYLKLNAGVAEDDGNASPAFAGGLAADWETRKLFTSYEFHLLEASNIERSGAQTARVGFAPYVAEYGHLHTWLMLQIDHHPQQEDNFVATPLVRLFKGPTLAEFGVTNNKEVMFNWINRF